MIQWLGLRASTAVGVGSIPGGGTKIPHAMQYGQKKNKKQKTKNNNNKKPKNTITNKRTTGGEGSV